MRACLQQGRGLGSHGERQPHAVSLVVAGLVFGKAVA